MRCAASCAQPPRAWPATVFGSTPSTPDEIANFVVHGSAPKAEDNDDYKPSRARWFDWLFAQILLDEFTAYGTAATVQAQLKEWDATVDLTMVALPPGLPWPRIEATIRAAAPQDEAL